MIKNAFLVNRIFQLPIQDIYCKFSFILVKKKHLGLSIYSSLKLTSNLMHISHISWNYSVKNIKNHIFYQYFSFVDENIRGGDFQKFLGSILYSVGKQHVCVYIYIYIYIHTYIHTHKSLSITSLSNTVFHKVFIWKYYCIMLDVQDHV